MCAKVTCLLLGKYTIFVSKGIERQILLPFQIFKSSQKFFGITEKLLNSGFEMNIGLQKWTVI